MGRPKRDEAAPIVMNASEEWCYDMSAAPKGIVLDVAQRLRTGAYASDCLALGFRTPTALGHWRQSFPGGTHRIPIGTFYAWRSRVVPPFEEPPPIPLSDWIAQVFGVHAVAEAEPKKRGRKAA